MPNPVIEPAKPRFRTHAVKHVPGPGKRRVTFASHLPIKIVFGPHVGHSRLLTIDEAERLAASLLQLAMDARGGPQLV